MQTSKSFFCLPQDVKKSIPKVAPVEQGFVRIGQEIFDAKEDWKEVSKGR